LVLDPFCGSGTVALEASIHGFLPLVADANPLALLLTKVKTTPYCIEKLIRIKEKYLINI
jgi:tRNA G10  N-methylase Trm11